MRMVPPSFQIRSFSGKRWMGWRRKRKAQSASSWAVERIWSKVRRSYRYVSYNGLVLYPNPFYALALRDSQLPNVGLPLYPPCLGVGWIQDTQCGFKVIPPLLATQFINRPSCTAVHSASRASNLPAPAPSKLDFRRRAPPPRLASVYPREGSPCALARSRG